MKKFSLLLISTLILVGGFVFAPSAQAAADIAITSARITSANTVLVTLTNPGDPLFSVSYTRWHIDQNDGGVSPLDPTSAVITSSENPWTITLTFAGTPFSNVETSYDAAHGLYVDASGVTDAAMDTNIVLGNAASIAVSDGQIPVISAVSITAGTYKIGSVIPVTITADAAGYTAGAITINGQALGNFTDAGAGSYTGTYTVVSGDTDRASVDAIPISVVLVDAATNSSAAYVTAPTSGGTVTVDANAPSAPVINAPTTPTNDNTPTITGTGENGATVVLTSSVDGAIADTAVVSGGTWSITPTVALTDAAHSLTAVQTDPSLNASVASGAQSVTVDTTAPTISAVSIPNAAMKVGDVVTATITVGDDGGVTYVLTSGTIDGFTLGGLTRTNSTTYTATFTVTNGGTDVAAGSDIAVANLILTDTAGNPSATYATPISQAADAIDANKPTIVSVTLSDSTIKVGDTPTLTVVMSEAVAGFDKTDVTMPNGTLGDLASADNITFTGTFTPDTIEDASNQVTVATTFTDVAGNAPAAGATSANYEIDTVVPTVTNVTATTANGSYKAADTIVITVTFSEAVNVVGVPQIELETGATNRYATYASGDGTATLTFNYTVQTGDTAADLDYVATGSLTLNGGTIKDAATNNATLTLSTPGAGGSLGANKAIVIDTTAPTVALTYSPDSNLSRLSIVTITATFTDTNNINETTVPKIAIVTQGNGDLSATNMTKSTNKVWTYSWQVPTNTTEGTSTISIVATDEAGNSNTTATNNTRVINDTTNPIVNSFTATSVTATGALLTVTTNEVATCKYANTETDYASMTTMATTTGVTTHSQSLTGLSGATTYNYYVRCADPSGNTMSNSAHVGFTTLGDASAPAGLAITTADATVNADYYTIAGTITADTSDVTVQVLNSSDAVGTAVITAGQTAWSVVVALPQSATTTFTARATDPTGNAALSTANADAALQSVVIAENATAGADVTAPTAPVITTTATTTNADYYTISGTVTSDASSTQVVKVFAGSNVYGTVIVPKSGTAWSVAVALPQSATTTFKATATDESGNVSSDSNTVVIVESTTAGQGDGTLAVTSITPVNTYATIGGGFDAGWSWTFNVTVPTSEASTTMKFADWVSGANTIAAASNIRFYSAQSSNANSTSTAITISAANTYSSAMALTGDLDAATQGRQIQITVEAQVPTGSAGGSYSTSYGIQSQ